MAAATTLMTFRVRTPPNTRTVELYGSWDNFSRPYYMQRDTRLGYEHWSGCHSFENIICDGRVSGRLVSRDGALKMGGTYWYYYRLDGDIEFHNSAEPSTTGCPLLPGQLVNVLQVPVALSGSRARNTSCSSTSSEHRTLNPEDRFMNPRPVPTPKFFRVNTSPTVPQLPFSSSNSPTTSNSSLSRCPSRENLTVPNMHRLARMASHEAIPKHGHSNSKSAGLRQAFKTLRTGRSQSPETKYKHIVDWKPLRDGHVTISAPQTPEPEVEATSYFEPRKPSPAAKPHEFLLRTSSDTSVPTTSFLEHRRERSRSRSRGPTSLRGSFFLDEDAILEVERALHQRNALETLIEAASPQPTPVAAMSTEAQREEDDEAVTPIGTQKRLPTLLDTSSSPWPTSHIEVTPRSRPCQLIDTSFSRFSASTIDTECHTYSLLMDDTSRFSQWSTVSDLVSPTSDGTVDDILASPIIDANDFTPAVRSVNTHTSELDGVYSPDESHDSIIMPTTSYKATSTSPLPEAAEHQPKCQLLHNASDFQHYRLPEAADLSSQLTSKSVLTQSYQEFPTLDPMVQSHRRTQSHQLSERRSGFPHSENMQQLLEELSYLSNVINHQ